MSQGHRTENFTETKRRFNFKNTMSIANTTTPHSVKPSTLRVRRYRERRREGLCSITVEMPKAVIEEVIAGGGLKPDYDAWDVGAGRLLCRRAGLLLRRPFVGRGIGMAHQEQGYQARAAW